MDMLMAVLTLHIIDEVGACIMFCPFFFMASMTGNRFSVNPRPCCLGVGLDVSDVPVAAIARVGSMNGLCKLPL
jgi:hypothetical protein